LKRLETSEVVICYKRAAGPKSGIYGPNKDFDQWKIDRLSTKSIPSLHRFLQINEIEGGQNTHLDGSNQPRLLDKALSIKLDKALSSNEEGLLDKNERLARQKTPSSWTKLCLSSTPANAVVEAIVRPREDKEDKEDNITPPTPVALPVAKVVVEVVEEIPSNVIHLPLTSEQIWASGRQKFRGQAKAMLMKKLSFGGLPLWATQDLDKLIDAEPPQGWSPKRWFTTLHDALRNAVYEAEQAWIKSSSSVKSGLRIALSRWKTNVSVAISTAAPTQHRGQL